MERNHLDVLFIRLDFRIFIVTTNGALPRECEDFELQYPGIFLRGRLVGRRFIWGRIGRQFERRERRQETSGLDGRALPVCSMAVSGRYSIVYLCHGYIV